MCEFCNSLFGHLSSCPDYSPGTRVYCISCENELDEGEVIVTFPNGVRYCESCVKELDQYELFDLLGVEDAFELVERFELCELRRIGGLR